MIRDPQPAAALSTVTNEEGEDDQHRQGEVVRVVEDADAADAELAVGGHRLDAAEPEAGVPLLDAAQGVEQHETGEQDDGAAQLRQRANGGANQGVLEHHLRERDQAVDVRLPRYPVARFDTTMANHNPHSSRS